MTYEELRKQATPGPYSVADGGHYYGGRWFICVPDGHCIAECNHDGVSTAERNCRYLHHCVNNFDKALEALKALAASQRYNQTRVPGSTIMDCDAHDALITELETVEDV